MFPTLAHLPSHTGSLGQAGFLGGQRDANILAVCGEQEPVRISALPHTHAQAEHSLLATQAKLTASRAGLWHLGSSFCFGFTLL